MTRLIALTLLWGFAATGYPKPTLSCRVFPIPATNGSLLDAELFESRVTTCMKEHQDIERCDPLSRVVRNSAAIIQHDHFLAELEGDRLTVSARWQETSGTATTQSPAVRLAVGQPFQEGFSVSVGLEVNCQTAFAGGDSQRTFKN